MTALVWILLGELVLVTLLTVAVSAFVARRRRRKTMEALNDLLDKLKQDEAARVSTLRQLIAQHPDVFGGDPATTATNWLSSEKDFIRALLPILLTDDIAALASLDQPLRRMLDERLPAAEKLPIDPPTEPTQDSGSPVISPENTRIAGSGSGQTVADLWNELNGIVQAVAATPAIVADQGKAYAQPLASTDEKTVDDMEQAFWSDMGYTDTLVPSDIEPDLEPLSHEPVSVEALYAAARVEDDTSTADDEPAATDVLEAPDEQSGLGGNTHILDDPSTGEEAAVTNASDPPDQDAADALDVDIWDELKALAQIELAEKEQKTQAELTPGAKQQDQSTASEQTAQ